jgi:hypothetical protein
VGTTSERKVIDLPARQHRAAGEERTLNLPLQPATASSRRVRLATKILKASQFHSGAAPPAGTAAATKGAGKGEVAAPSVSLALARSAALYTPNVVAAGGGASQKGQLGSSREGLCDELPESLRFCSLERVLRFCSLRD